MAGSIYLEIDASEFNEDINRLKSAMQPEQFNRAMYGIFQRTGRHVASILKKDLPKEYEVKPGEVGRAVKKASLTMGGNGVGCSIPITAARKSIGGGGSGFTAYGYRRGWNSLKGKYRVKAKIVKAGQSTLPGNASSYGGMPPFRNIPSKLGGLTFTRAGKDRLPIMKMSGIAIPQMPMNRSESDVQHDIKVYLEKQIEQRLYALLLNGR